MKGPRIYRAINAVMSELASAGIGKTHTNTQDQYRYRSIDDVLNRLAPLLAKHRLCVLPRVLERVAVDRQSSGDELLIGVALKVAFDLVSATDESLHTVEAYGEALDGSDKATSKAMSSAYKAAMLQTFCIPVAGTEEPDAFTYRLRRLEHEPPPVQGWEQWANEIGDLIAVCESEEALARVRETHRPEFKSISRERSDLYHSLGEAFRVRREALATPKQDLATKQTGGRRTRNRQATQPEIAHA